jgi:uncharacterized metal-binding protein
MEEAKGEGPRIFKPCHEVAERENMIWLCDGAANVGQVGHEVGVALTNMGKGRMCCITAVAAGSKPHLEIAERAKKNIVINGCANRCASKIFEKAGERIDYEIVLSKYLQKISTLDFYVGDVKKITDIIVKEANI